MLTHRFATLLLATPLLLWACGKEETPAPSPSPPPSATAGREAPSATQVATTLAQKLLDDAAQEIKDNKLDLAEKAIQHLEDMKANLPPEYGPKIDSLRKAFDAAKAAMPAATKMPGQ